MIVLARPKGSARAQEEFLKLPAFLRRDIRVAISYRAAFVGDIVSLLMQALLFSFIAKLVDERTMPVYGGHHATYLEFATVGIAVGAFAQLGIGRVATAIRSEQLMGTLDAMLATPTAAMTIQVGSVVFDLVYVPLRTAAFFALMFGAYPLNFRLSGLVPSMLVLLLLVPSVWGLGVIGAAAIMTFRRGNGTVGIAAMLLSLASGAYFPLSLLPSWLQALAAANPMAIALGAIRNSLLGGAGFTGTEVACAELALWAVCTLAIGLFAFRLATNRERRLGTLGLY